MYTLIVGRQQNKNNNNKGNNCKIYKYKMKIVDLGLK